MPDYGGLGVWGLFRSPVWLAAGWALHPVWDLGLHYFGPGHAFAPDAYAVTCLSFDLLVAGYVAIRYRDRLVRSRSDRLESTALSQAHSLTTS